MKDYFALYNSGGEVFGFDFPGPSIDTNGRDIDDGEFVRIVEAARVEHDRISAWFHQRGGIGRMPKPLPVKWLAFYARNRCKPLWVAKSLRVMP